MRYQILRLPDVTAVTKLSRSTIYLRMTKGTFPRTISLGPRMVGWLEEEIQAWLQGQIEARDKTEA